MARLLTRKAVTVLVCSILLLSILTPFLKLFPVLPVKATSPIFYDNFESGSLNPSKWAWNQSGHVQSNLKYDGFYAVNISDAGSIGSISGLDLTDCQFSFWWRTNTTLNQNIESHSCELLYILYSGNSGYYTLYVNSTKGAIIYPSGTYYFPVSLSTNIWYNFTVSFIKNISTGLTNSTIWVNNVQKGNAVNINTAAEADDTFYLYGTQDDRHGNTFYDDVLVGALGAGEEHIVNGGFELGDGISPWTAFDSYGLGEASNTEHHSGTNSCKLQYMHSIHQSGFGNISASLITYFTFWMKNSGYEPHGVAVKIEYNDSSSTEADQTVSTVWANISLLPYLEAGKFVSGIDFYYYWDTGEVYIDDVSLWTGPPPPPPSDITPPQYSGVVHAGTSAATWGYAACDWVDDWGLSSWTFASNNTGHWLNNTAETFSGRTGSSFTLFLLNSTVGVKVKWKIYANDTSNNWNVTYTETIIITVANPMQFTNIGYSAIYPNYFVRMWADVSFTYSNNVTLAYWIFGLNSSGAWYNFTSYPISGESAHMDTFSLGDIYLPSSFTCVDYAFWVKDANGNWGFSGVQHIFSHARDLVTSGTNIILNSQFQRNSLSYSGARYQFYFNTTDSKVYYSCDQGNSTWKRNSEPASPALYNAVSWSVFQYLSDVYLSYTTTAVDTYLQEGVINAVEKNIHWIENTFITHYGWGWSSDVCVKFIVPRGMYDFVSLTGLTDVMVFWKLETDLAWQNQTIFTGIGAGSTAEVYPTRSGIYALTSNPDHGANIYYWTPLSNTFAYMSSPGEYDGTRATTFSSYGHSLAAQQSGNKVYFMLYGRQVPYAPNTTSAPYVIRLYQTTEGSTHYNQTLLASSSDSMVFAGTQVFVYNDKYVVAMWNVYGETLPPYSAYIRYVNYTLDLSTPFNNVWIVRPIDPMYLGDFMVGYAYGGYYSISWLENGSNIVRSQITDWYVPMIPLTANLTVLAHNVVTHTDVNVQIQTSNGTYTTPAILALPLNSSYYITVPASWDYNIDYHMDFKNWTDGYTGLTRTGNLTADIAYTANYMLVHNWDSGGFVNMFIGLIGLLMMGLSWVIAKSFWDQKEYGKAIAYWLLLFIIGFGLFTVLLGG